MAIIAKRQATVKDFHSHSRAWRDPGQVVSNWQSATDTDPAILRFRATGDWWQAVHEAKATLLVTRETEHLVLAIGHPEGSPEISYLRLPHPSGVAVDRLRGRVHVASTRNPNQVLTLAPAADAGHPLMPTTSRYYPGRLYLHDLAVIDGVLQGNAVGMNAVVTLEGDGGWEASWWPACIDSESGPRWSRNYLQLNSIAAGKSLHESYFTASAEQPSGRRPGHLNFAVDGRGVVFAGATRDVVVRGLTRPHSARLHDGRLWIDNSGYGTLGICADGSLTVVSKLPGWTRGLCFVGQTAFVGTSNVINRFRHYAPGLANAQTRCGVHAVDIATGHVRGSLIWPTGNQIFAVDWIESVVSRGLPFTRSIGREKASTPLFYSFGLAQP